MFLNLVYVNVREKVKGILSFIILHTLWEVFNLTQVLSTNIYVTSDKHVQLNSLEKNLPRCINNAFALMF